MPNPDPQTLAALPFADQLARIDAAIAARAGLPELVTELGTLRDHEPLACALERLAAEGLLLEGEPLRARVQELFFALPDSGLHRILRHLDRAGLPAAQLQPLVACAAAAARDLPAGRLAAICLLDRWLKNMAAEAREGICRAALERCRATVRAGRVAELEDGALLRIPGVSLAALDDAAREAGRSAELRARLSAFAATVLDTLAALPKSLSQANAEEILSRRVYTDPGHFFFELLQNAEDAGARTFAVDVEDARILVWHDGVPFDAKDVVGVLSIGQTTKRRGQIGFFGVGFKAVYEICERPQIHSGPYSFEIADISLPKRLAGRPAAAPADGTLLVLPLRDPADTARRPEELHRRALSVPAETLLTLANVRSLRVGRHGAARTLRREEGTAPGRVTLASLEAATARRYLVESDRFRPPGEAREATRPRETPVAVAIALTERGLATPLVGPTVFSYLPTGERSGLRFLVHAHFDLPVDRERLDLGAAWNRFAITRAGVLLARVARRLCDEGSDDELRALLGVLPAADELGHPAYAGILDELRDGVRDLALLVGAAGERLAPGTAALIADDGLRLRLAGIPLDDAGRRALAPLGAREEGVARSLGAAPFGLAELVALIARTVAGCEGQAPPAPWFAPALPAILDALAHGGEAALLQQLAALPFLTDASGRLRCPRQLAHAEPELRGLYREAVLLVDERLEEIGADGVRLLERLGVRALSPAGLARDLEDDALARRILASAGAERLLRYLTQVPPHLTAALGARALFPDLRGEPRPLAAGSAPAPAWLSPEGPLGELLRELRGTAPPLVDAHLQGLFAPFLRSLGAGTLELPQVLAAVAAGELTLSAGEALRLHGVIDALRAELSPRVCAALTRAPIFPDRRGVLRPLAGPDRALVPGDDDVIGLAAGAPWIAGDVARLPYVATLGIAAVGPAAVVRGLAGAEGEDALRVDAGDAAALRRVYAYLASHRAGLPADLLARLAAAPVWLDESGARRPLASLRRRPTAPDLAALYRAWDAFAMIEEDGAPSAAALAAALGLDRHLAAPSHETLVDDLCAGAPIDPTSELRPLLVAALAEAARRVPAPVLRRLGRAEIFRGTGGVVGPLGSWDAPARPGCFRAQGAVRAPLALGARALLLEDDEAELAPLLQALGERSAGIGDLARALESDPALATPQARARARTALVALAAAGAAPTGAELALLLAQPLWPARDGRVLRARDLARERDVAHELGAEWAAALFADRLDVALLDESAEADADALRAWFSFWAPALLVVARLREDARAGAQLAAQPPWLRTREQLGKLLALLHRYGAAAAELAALPIALDARGRLTTGRLLAATAREAALVRPLALYDALADPAWAAEAAAIAPEVVAPLPARRLLAALAEVSREPGPSERHPCLGSEDARSSFYTWLQGRAAEIEGDPQARGVLGKACLFETERGTLRAPGDLLLDRTLPDLGLDWRVGPVVPAELVAWLRRVYRLDEARLRALVGYLLDAHEEAARAGDVARSEELLGFLARALGGALDGSEEAAGLLRRLDIRRRLNVATGDGSFARARKLLLPTEGRWELLAAFLETPPARVSPRYADPRVWALLLAVGARPDLSPEELLALLGGGPGKRPGLEAALAFARYAALLAEEQPAVRAALARAGAAWIPDGEGVAKPAASLYSPDEDVAAVVGDRPGLFPHPIFWRTVTEALAAKLPFRTVDEVALADVLQRLSDGEAAAPGILRWLEEGLKQRRVEAKTLRAALDTRRFLLDDEGEVRSPRELLRTPARALFGSRRGVFGEHRLYPRLCDALGIAPVPGPREVLAFLDDVAVDLARLGPAPLLAEGLASCLTRCLAFLAEATAAPPARERWPIAATGARGEAEETLCFAGDPRLVLPEPAELLDEAAEADPALLVPCLDEEGRDAVVAYLRRAGLRDLAPRAAEPLPAREPRRSEPEPGEPRRPEPEPGEPRRPEPEPGEPRRPEPREPRRLEPEPRLPRPPPPRPERPRLLDRLRRWMAQDAPRPAPAPPPVREAAAPERPRAEPRERPPPGSAGQGAWFEPSRSIGSQLAQGGGWSAAQAETPRFGFAFAPRPLPPPYLYAPKLVANRFDARSQRWVRDALPRAWREPAAPGRVRVELHGRVPAGEVVLPVPLYGRATDVRAEAPIQVITAQGGETLVFAARELDVRYTVVLDEAPRFAESPAHEPAPRELLEHTARDDDLPDEVHDFLAGLEGEEPTALGRALAVRGFVQRRYRYDPTYLEEAAVARWLDRVGRGRQHAHLAALHAVHDEEHLGAGVCYELNVLACELLRRAGVPAAIGTGWTFDRGYVTAPDHLWVMALCPSDVGPRWLPLDASTTRDGRPLHAARRPAGRWKVKPQAGPEELPPAPPWVDRGKPRAWESRPVLPLADLLRVARHVEALTGERTRGEAALRRRCEALLSDPELARRLLALLAAEP